MLLMVLSGLVLWAQQGGGAGGAGGVLGGIIVCYGCGFLAMILTIVAAFAGMWKTFEKAGEPGWAAIVPVYHAMIMSKIAGRGETYGLLVYIPCVGPIFLIIILLDFCKKFDVGTGFAIGLFLLGAVFWPIMGFGSTRFIGGGSGRRRAVDEDDDDDAPRSRPRRRDDDDDDDRIRKPRRRDDD